MGDYSSRAVPSTLISSACSGIVVGPVAARNGGFASDDKTPPSALSFVILVGAVGFCNLRNHLAEIQTRNKRINGPTRIQNLWTCGNSMFLWCSGIPINRSFLPGRLSCPPQKHHHRKNLFLWMRVDEPFIHSRSATPPKTGGRKSNDRGASWPDCRS